MLHLKQSGCRVILIEKQAPDALINALAAEGFEVVRMDILSTGNAQKGAEGYFAAMHDNLDRLQQALNKK